MAIPINLRRSALYILLGVYGCPWGSALAHTDVTDEVTEGSAVFNKLVIEHGCENPITGRQLPVIAQSVVFPTENPAVTRSDGSASPGLSAEIQNPIGLAGLITPIQDKNIFRKQKKITDANDNTIGFFGTGGSLNPELMGLVPFYVVPVSFQATSCAKSLVVQIAVADICTRAFPPKAGTANLWIPAATSKFNGANIEGIGTPAVLTFKRNLETNPLPVHCGNGYDVTVTPTEADVNQHLPIKGYWAGRS